MIFFGFEYPTKDVVFNLLIILITAIATGILTFIASLLFDSCSRKRRYNEALGLLKDEITILDTDPGVFSEDPKKIHLLNPINIYGPNLLLKEHFERLSKNNKLLHSITDLNVSILNHNSFLDSYNQVVWSHLGDIEIKRKMFMNAEHMRDKVRIDRLELLKILKMPTE